MNVPSNSIIVNHTYPGDDTFLGVTTNIIDVKLPLDIAEITKVHINDKLIISCKTVP